jgi:nicotinamidase-related amidase
VSLAAEKRKRQMIGCAGNRTMTAGLLLILDVQTGLINESTAHLPARVEALQSAFESVIITRLYNPQKSLFRKLLAWEALPLGGRGTQLAFAPRADAKVIDKSSYSCVNSEFLDDLRRRALTRVHLCGIATEGSVLASAIDLFDAGIEPVVLAHACASDADPSLHQAALAILRKTIGKRNVIES